MANLVDLIEAGGIVSIRDRLLTMQASGRPICRLESGDPSFDVPPNVIEAIQKALKDGKTHYTTGAGIAPLREAIFEKVSRENLLDVNGPDDVFVTNGAMHGLYVTFRAICDLGDEVIIPSPTWTETADNIVLAGAVPIHATFGKNFTYDSSCVRHLINAKTRAIVVNSPHNPTGRILTSYELKSLVDVARDYGLWLISDEAYEHITFDDRTHQSPGSLGYDHVISVYSMSKSYAMSGLRVGYIVVTDPMVKNRVAKLLRCTINGVNSATQWGAVAALSGDQKERGIMRTTLEKRKNLLFNALQESIVLKPVKPEGAFYCWCRNLTRLSSWDFVNWLIDRHGIGCTPGEAFGPAGSGWLRLSFSCPTEHVQRAGEILQRISP